ncbi:MAG: SMC-Scp complex subunit ScpB [Bacteriovoracaceae bacterium]
METENHTEQAQETLEVQEAKDAQDAQEVQETQSADETEEFSLELNFLDEEKQKEKEWKEKTGLNEVTILAAIETIVFMSEKPVSIEKIKKAINSEMPLRPIYTALSELQAKYEEPTHGIRLVEVAEGYQFRTKLNYANYVETVHKSNSFTLTPTALEVLAIIAYRQPISRTEIDRLRGVDSSHIVRALMDKRLVAIAGRSDELGRPTTFKTTPEFLEFFNLADLSDLPDEEELKEMTASGVGEISDIKDLVKKTGEGEFSFDDIDELDQLASEIKEIASDTEFTKLLKQKPKKDEEGVGAKALSPFEIIEDFLNQEQISTENQKAMESELFTAVTDVEIISNPQGENDYNIPEEGLDLNDLETAAPVSDGDLYEEIPEREQLEQKFKEIQELPNKLEELEKEDEELLAQEETLSAEESPEVEEEALFSDMSEDELSDVLDEKFMAFEDGESEESENKNENEDSFDEVDAAMIAKSLETDQPSDESLLDSVDE